MSKKFSFERRFLLFYCLVAPDLLLKYSVGLTELYARVSGHLKRKVEFETSFRRNLEPSKLKLLTCKKGITLFESTSVLQKLIADSGTRTHATFVTTNFAPKNRRSTLLDNITFALYLNVAP